METSGCSREAVPDSLVLERIEFQTPRCYDAPDTFLDEKDPEVADIQTLRCAVPDILEMEKTPDIHAPDSFVDEKDLEVADIQTSMALT